MNIKNHLAAKIVLFTIFLLTIGILFCNHHFQLYAFNPYSVCMTKGLRVMTWNVHISDPNFKSKQPAIAAEIIAQDADIVLINEFDQKRSAVLDSLVRRAYPYVADRYGWGCGDILYSRYPIASYRRLEQPSFSTLCYEYQLTVKEQKIRVVGCHLISTNNFSKDHRYTLQNAHDIFSLPDYYSLYETAKERRTQEAELIREYLLAEDLPTIVLGDMNDFSGTAPLNTLESTGLKDAWWERGKGFGITFREGWMRFRLDHILYDSHWNPISIRVVQSDLSDHLPLVGEFSMK